ncbi:MAG TPA: hypothetical protein VLL98_01100 [Rickettsiales bacterium]|nr:hypothetical protein [Rickettsiales bacterium]
MQNILYFNTIFQGINIILQLNDGLILEQNFENIKQSEILVSSLEQVLHDNGLNYRDINVFTSIVGPGNFTGIKTSLAVLKALQVSTEAKIITCNAFDVISFAFEFDLIVFDMGTIKYYVKENNDFYTIYKKDLKTFLEDKKDKKIISNDRVLNENNIIYSDFTNQKWVDLINYKVKNKLWADDIKPLYIEEAGITKRKS